MKKFLTILWPSPEGTSAADQKAIKQQDLDIDTRIMQLKGFKDLESATYLDAVRCISNQEDKRKLGAENRATTFIAAVAALIPLMTWAIGSTPLSCSSEWGCSPWIATFILAVAYFVGAAYWALQALAVANYHVIGVEDIVRIKETDRDIVKELIRQTLLQARKNRNTINQKLTYINVAQRAFFNGLVLFGLLLMFDPISKSGALSFIQSEAKFWVCSYVSVQTPNAVTLGPILCPARPMQAANDDVPHAPASPPATQQSDSQY